MYRNQSDGISANLTLPAGFLENIPSQPIESCLLQFVGCPIPDYRPDLKNLNLTEDYILQQIDLVKALLLEADDRPQGVSDDDLLAIGAFTLESSIYKLLNAWGNMSNRNVEDMKYVAPYLKFLIDALRRLPECYRYRGFGVRVLDASIPVMKMGWDNYKEHFAKGKSVNFHSVCSFGRDEKLLDDFINRGINHPVIVLRCENISGYLIENISMMPRLNNKNEGEVIVEGPSFFIVKIEPIKVHNFVIVDIEWNERISQVRAYLPNKRGEKERLIEQEKREKEKNRKRTRTKRKRTERKKRKRKRTGTERKRTGTETKRTERKKRKRTGTERKRTERK